MMLNEKYRGLGQTELMIANLPAGQCTIVTPTAGIGREVAERVKKASPGLRRYITIRHPSDAKKLTGLSEPVFFDHSFFGLASKETAEAAVQAAIPCAYHGNWRERADG